MAGLVTDLSGGVLPGATIEARRGLRALAVATTGVDGRYRLELPPEGAERVAARLAGFAPAAVDLTVAAGAATLDFQLDLAPLQDTVVVTASRTAERRASVTESHAVFTADEIERLGSHSVADVLQQVPGFSVQSTGREGSIASVFVRGGEADYNHVLIDGVRVNADGGIYDFGRVAAGEIERVEVVRGAQSALYGSDAIGSVIQIFTKRGAPDSGPGCPAPSRGARSALRAATCGCSAAPAGGSITSSASPTAPRTARSRTASRSRTVSTSR